MPSAEQYLKHNAAENLRTLIYGNPKTKKTTWCLEAANAGFNVILIQFDPDGVRVLTNGLIPTKAMKRISIIDVSPKMGCNAPYLFMKKFFTYKKVIINEAHNTTSESKLGLMPGQNYASINKSLLGANDIIVFDSYTSYVDSLLLAYAQNQNPPIDLAEAEKQTWDGWGWMGRHATWALDNILKLPCHIILVGHEQIYEKRGKDRNGKDIVVSSRTQIKSVSGPHGHTVSKDFSDVLHFKKLSTANMISTIARQDFDGGSRSLAPKDYEYTTLSYATVASSSKVYPKPELVCKAVDFGTVGKT